jgi:ankyrin repeat protein
LSGFFFTKKKSEEGVPLFIMSTTKRSREEKEHPDVLDCYKQGCRRCHSQNAPFYHHSSRRWLTPLMAASVTRDVEATKALLKAGAQVDHVVTGSTGMGIGRKKSNYRAIHWAALYGADECLQLLIEQDCHVQAKTSGIAVASFDQFSAAMECNLPGYDSENYSSYCKDWTALHCAAHNGHASTVGILLAAGVPVDAKDDDGCTALYYAVKKGHAEVVRALIEAGATTNVEAFNGTTTNNGKETSPVSLLAMAARYHFTEVIEELADHVDVDRERQLAAESPYRDALLRACYSAFERWGGPNEEGLRCIKALTDIYARHANFDQFD